VGLGDPLHQAGELDSSNRGLPEHYRATRQLVAV